MGRCVLNSSMLETGMCDCICFAQFVHWHAMWNAWPPSDAPIIVFFSDGVAGKTLCKKRIARWLCECITQVYIVVRCDPPLMIHSYSTCCVAVSMALLGRTSVEDRCVAVGVA